MPIIGPTHLTATAISYSEIELTWDPAIAVSPFGDRLKLDGLEIEPVTLAVERLKCTFGQGYGASSSTGSGSGLWGWEIGSDCLPDDPAYQALINGVPRFQYYTQFYLDHTEGDAGEVFWIDFRGKKFPCAFADDSIAGNMQTYDLFDLSGVKLEHRRIPGTLYNDDGSIFEPFAWLRSDAIVGKADADSMVGPWPDYLNGTDWTVESDGTTPTYETNEVNGYPVVRLIDGDVTLPSIFTCTDIFIVLKIREATFSAARGIVSDGDTENWLTGSNATTKFADLSLSNYEYRMNGTLYVASNQQAPMNTFGVVHIRRTGGSSFAFSGQLYVGQDADLAVAGKCDVAEVIIPTTFGGTQISTGMMSRITNSLMKRYGISA